MSSSIGRHINMTIFGESHGPAIGVVLTGLPAGEPVDTEAIAAQMARRAPGGDLATPRRETDAFTLLSGVLDGKTTGAPLCATIENHDTRSGDYAALARLPRPSHADYPASVRYGGHNDVRGGGHFSGRLTAPLVLAGAICRQILARRGVTIGAHLCQIGAAADRLFDPCELSPELLNLLSNGVFSVLDEEAGERMKAQIRDAQAAGDSIGGRIEAAAVGLPVGLGDPMFGGVESVLSALLYGVPAVKAVAFGSGFDFAMGRGSEMNDPYLIKDGRIATSTNHNGGVLGGLATGMPLLVQVAVKPTPSIAQRQQTVDLTSNTPAELCISGRHDPCIAPRAVPVVEGALAVGLLDLMMGKR